MTFTGFTEEDFNVFQIDGLDARMDALIQHIRPKLTDLAEYFTPTLTVLTGDEMFAHVAKHARRTINPPNDTWVAFANNRRGYKMLPHFQIGLWETHVFIWFAIIYEAPDKVRFGKSLEAHLEKIHKEIPADYVWSFDHTKPEAILHRDLSKEDLLLKVKRLQTVKKAEILCGYHLTKEEAIALSGQEFLIKVDSVLRHLVPLYTFLG
ncbi:YktB family protein [Cytobacillus sp. Hz8]|uniref:YktB family protein n=1 Tax=Cytobacillus sp. Hz8 TaxID=3347168 RepID=UPI0035D6D2F3